MKKLRFFLFTLPLCFGTSNIFANIAGSDDIKPIQPEFNLDFEEQSERLEDKLRKRARFSFSSVRHMWVFKCGTSLLNRRYRRSQRNIIFHNPVVVQTWIPVNGKVTSETSWQATVVESYSY